MALFPKGLLATPTIIGAKYKLDFAQNFITTQNSDEVFGALAYDSWAFDGTEGLGTALLSSTVAVVRQGGPVRNMEVEAYFKSPLLGALAHFGVMARITHFAPADYYWARYTAGVFRISKTLGGTTTTLGTSTSITVNIDDIVRLKIRVSGVDIEAECENITTVSGTTQKTTTDSDITLPGFAGFRSGITTSALWVRSATAVAI